MAHNLNIENGKANMMYVGERPWHGLGTELKRPATAKEAIEASGLNYNIELQEIYTEKQIRVKNNFATVRVDTQKPLGIVTDRYSIVQNSDAFNFFDTVVGDGQAIYHTAGALGEGERIWLLAKLPKDIIVAKNGDEDRVEKFLCLTNTHDGTSSLKMYFTPIRIVCQNTLNISMKNMSNCISIRHCGDIKDKVNQARKVLGVSINWYNQFESIAKQLVDVKLDTQQADTYFDRIVYGKKEETNNNEKNDSTRSKNIKNNLLHLFEYGKGNKSTAVKHSAWAAYNAVTEFVDHYRVIRGEESNPSNYLDAIWFGSGAKMKETAFAEVCSLANISTK